MLAQFEGEQDTEVTKMQYKRRNHHTHKRGAWKNLESGRIFARASRNLVETSLFFHRLYVITQCLTLNEDFIPYLVCCALIHLLEHRQELHFARRPLG